MMVSFVLSFFPRDVLDEILNLIESVSEDFPSYSYLTIRTPMRLYKRSLPDDFRKQLPIQIKKQLFLRQVVINTLYTGRLFHCYMSDESICHFRGVASIFVSFILVKWEILLADTVDSDQIILRLI